MQLNYPQTALNCILKNSPKTLSFKKCFPIDYTDSQKKVEVSALG